MTLLLGSMLISLVFFGLVRGNYVSFKVNMSCENGVCSRKADQGPCVVKDDQQRLFRWEPVKVFYFLVPRSNIRFYLSHYFTHMIVSKT